ncbi:Uncharacterized protein OBRU01_23160 [Operophtera brumata]|uniref:Alpha-1,4-N-acetylglucosaminyltransferase n=1 Tax=Operophtera brumata TaxID=104452 RepID=A0A0L7KPD5_OPEBR|nr:Uncharacterized protein OBRU01_23160 [Operophtera brumata]
MADDGISCHYIAEGDSLLSAEDTSFSPPTDSIFFHETSCRGGLNSRQACAVESAAKSHPWRNIYVLFSGPVTESALHITSSSLFVLKKYPNINFARVHIDEYAKNTAVEEFLAKKTIHASPYKITHTSNYLRFITLFKYGGLYLDMDMIVLKPFYGLGRNWVVRENDHFIGSAVVNAAKDGLGQEFTRRVLE